MNYLCVTCTDHRDQFVLQETLTFITGFSGHAHYFLISYVTLNNFTFA